MATRVPFAACSQQLPTLARAGQRRQRAAHEAASLRAAPNRVHCSSRVRGIDHSGFMGPDIGRLSDCVRGRGGGRVTSHETHMATPSLARATTGRPPTQLMSHHAHGMLSDRGHAMVHATLMISHERNRNDAYKYFRARCFRSF